MMTTSTKAKYIPLMYDATEDEIEVIGHMMRAGAFSTINAVFRVALWKLAQHLDVECPGDTFQLYIPPKKGEAHAHRDPPPLV